MSGSPEYRARRKARQARYIPACQGKMKPLYSLVERDEHENSCPVCWEKIFR